MKNWRILAAIGAAVALSLPAIVHDGYIIQLLNIAILNAIVVLGLNFATGWTGQINFGQAAFYGLGAYTTAIATKAGLPWITTPLLSVIVPVTVFLFCATATVITNMENSKTIPERTCFFMLLVLVLK